jgi:anti-anti-sigma factor
MEENKLVHNMSVEENIAILKLNGELDMYSIPDAQLIIDSIIYKGFFKLIIDLEKIEYLDSSGIGFFTGSLKKLKELGGGLKLINLNPYITRIFNLLHLDYFIDIYDTKEDAINDFKKDTLAAIDKWKKVIKYEPKYADAHFNLAKVLYDFGEIDEAAEELKNAIKINTKYKEAFLLLGKIYFNKDDKENAIKYYNSVLEIDNKNVDAVAALGSLYNDKNMLNEAIKKYREILDAHPTYPDMYNKLGKVLERAGMIEQAIKEYKSAIKINPKYTEAHLNLAFAYKQKQDIEQAIKEFEKVVRYSLTDQDKKVAIKNLHELKLQIGKEILED